MISVLYTSIVLVRILLESSELRFFGEFERVRGSDLEDYIVKSEMVRSLVSSDVG